MSTSSDCWYPHQLVPVMPTCVDTQYKHEDIHNELADWGLEEYKSLIYWQLITHFNRILHFLLVFQQMLILFQEMLPHSLIV